MNLLQLPLKQLQVFYDPPFPATSGEKEAREKLRLSLRSTGQEVPIIVNHRGVVIDGRARVSLLQAAGKSTVLAYQVHTFDQVCEALEAVRLASDKIDWPINLSSNRLYQLVKTVRPIADAEDRAKRSSPAKVRLVQKKFGFRENLAQALGFPAVTIFQHLTFLYSRADDPMNPNQHLAQELIARHNAGEIPLYIARRIYKEKVEGQSPGRIPRPRSRGSLRTEQVGVIKSTSSNLAGMVKVLTTMGPLPNDLTDEEVGHWLRQLKKSRTELSKAIRLIEEKVQK